MADWKPLSPPQVHRLPMGVAFGRSVTGPVRQSNQDNLFISPELNLVVVADGMGGHAAGDVASASAIELLCSQLAAAPDPDATWPGAAVPALRTLRQAVAFANDTLYRRNAALGHAEGTGMGTTLTGMWQPARHAASLVFHVGDSRLYCYRAGVLTQLTHDQTLYQQAVDLDLPEPLPPRNLLLQAVGPGATVEPEVLAHATCPGDVYLLCSDGLHGDSSDADIAAILASATPGTLDACCDALLALAERDGSRDNITALLLYCG